MPLLLDSEPNFNGRSELEIPPAVDEHRPPQLNTCTCRSCGCGCSGSQGGGGNGDLEGPGQRDEVLPGGPVGAIDNAIGRNSDDGISDSGDEGVETLLDVSDMGFIGVGTLISLLHRRRHCTCGTGILPHVDDFPLRFYISAPAPLAWSPQSKSVEPSSGEHSLEASMMLSSYNASSSDLVAMGTGFDQGYSEMAPSCLVDRPLLLSPELSTAAPVQQISQYPRQLSISSNGSSHLNFGEYDFW